MILTTPGNRLVVATPSDISYETPCALYASDQGSPAWDPEPVEPRDFLVQSPGHESIPVLRFWQLGWLYQRTLGPLGLDFMGISSAEWPGNLDWLSTEGTAEDASPNQEADFFQCL